MEEEKSTYICEQVKEIKVSFKVKLLKYTNKVFVLDSPRF